MVVVQQRKCSSVGHVIPLVHVTGFFIRDRGVSTPIHNHEMCVKIHKFHTTYGP